MGMAKPQIEGAKPSFMARVGSSITTTVLSKFKVGTPLYSLGFGAAGGLLISGLVYTGRTLNILFFDHEYYKLQSRKRNSYSLVSKRRWRMDTILLRSQASTIQLLHE